MLALRHSAQITTAEVLSLRLGMKHPPDYAETAELTFRAGPGYFPRVATIARRLVNLFIIMTQLGFCCVYFVFVATNIRQVLNQHIVAIDVHAYMAMALVPMLLLSLVRNLKYLAPVSLASNVVMCAGVAVTLYECAKDGLPPLSERRLVAEWQRWPLFFGTVVYSFESICIVMPLRNEMKNPRDFSRPLGVMNVGSVFIGVLLVSLGSVGYLKFGDAVKGSLTLNLEQTSVLCQVLRVSLCLGIMGTYPLQAYVPIEILWPSIERRFRPLRHPALAELALRACVVLFTFLLAESIPRLNLFISLVGALSSSALAFVFPPLLDWAWRWHGDPKLSLRTHITNAVILAVGLLVTGWGTYAALKDIIEALATGIDDDSS
ncbi:proton-coupled amino acid transporter 1 isoform X2 [Thrips palmi]|uniref:Proton-coupled amino acid transporter 1 isoform X2 n=1 Tax=Thrips palmi TaxID=161013 RepID=A0A6P9ADF1_THRPL|nr:proton-coupled amino acid transporter 1 isoform X2 [Thrips palmi]